MNNKLTNKLIRRIVMIGFIIVTLVIFFITNIIQEYERDRMYEAAKIMSRAMKAGAGQAFDDLMDNTLDLKTNMDGLVFDDHINADNINSVLKTHLMENHAATGTFVILEDEGFTYHPYWYRKDDEYYQSYFEDYNSDEYLKLIEAGQSVILDPSPVRQGEETALLSTVILPIQSEGTTRGIVGVNFSIEFPKGFSEDLSVTDVFGSYLLSGNGIVIGNSDNSMVGMSMEEAGIPELWISEEFRDKGMIRSGDNYVMNIPIEVENFNQNWTFIATAPYSVLHGENMKMQLIVSIPVLIGIMLLAVFVRYTVKKNLRPIEDILLVMESAEKGDFSQRTHVHSSDEIQVIGEGLNALLISLEDHHEKLLKEIEDNELLNKELEELMQENDRIYFETIKSLNMAIEAKDHYTAGHCDRVTEFSLAIANEVGLSDKEKVRLVYGATVHDIGKIGIPGQIINKAGRLSDEEFERIKSHPEKGYNILKGIHFLEDAIPIVYQHHERFDGRGYPRGLKGEEIDLSARIVAIADTYDAMTSDRAYRKALPQEIAIEELLKNKGSQFDPDLVDAFMKVLDVKIGVDDKAENIS